MSLDDQLEHARVAEIALAEIEAEIVPHHHEEALVGRLVEAELLLQALDEFGIEALRAAIFGGRRDVARRAARPARPPPTSPPPPLNLAVAPTSVPVSCAISALHRAARRELHDDEGHQHDADHGRHDEQKPAKDIGSHAGTKNDPLLLRFAGVSQLSAADTTLPQAIEGGMPQPGHVIAGLDPAIQDHLLRECSWIPGSRPGMIIHLSGIPR